jgi:hypothetical protein
MNENDTSSGDIPEQVGRLVRGALDDWGRTLRLCLVGLICLAIWTGVEVVMDLVEAHPSSVCVTTTSARNAHVLSPPASFPS